MRGAEHSGSGSADEAGYLADMVRDEPVASDPSDKAAMFAEMMAIAALGGPQGIAERQARQRDQELRDLQGE